MRFTESLEESINYVTDLLDCSGLKFAPKDWPALKGGESFAQLEKWVEDYMDPNAEIDIPEHDDTPSLGDPWYAQK